MWPVLLIGGALVAYLFSRPAPVEGRSWRLMQGISQADWPRIYPGAMDRLPAVRAKVAVKIQSKETGAQAPVLVQVTGRSGDRLEGFFTRDDDWTLPRPWGPAEGAPVSFELRDVWMIQEDS